MTEIANHNNDLLAPHTYHHDGDQEFLIGIVDPVKMSSFFNQHVPIFAAEAFQSPPAAGGVQFHDIFTLFLDATNGSGGIDSVINGVGGSSTAANPDTPVAVFSYP